MQVTTSPNTVNFAYDLNANLTFDGSTTYGYDAENRLISATGAKNATLSYDPMGRLFQSNSTQFLFDGTQIIGEYNTSGTLLRRYVNGDSENEPLVWYEGSLASAGARRYLHADRLGSIIAFTNSSGVTLEKDTYDPFGVQGTTNTSRFQFTGQMYLPELGLYYYKARFYNASIGRFMQTDPVGYGADLYLYAYGSNDPTNRIDPSGLDGEGLTAEDWRALLQQAERAAREAEAAGSAAESASAARVLTLVRTLSVATIPLFIPGDTPQYKTVYATYTKQSDIDGKIYSGRTGIRVPINTPVAAAAQVAVMIRDLNHHKTRDGYGPASLDKGSNSYNAIRGREQQLIDHYGGAQSVGGTSGNRINGISDYNPMRGTYMNSSTAEFGYLESNRPNPPPK
jgi:RHS repeat-associated protein